MKIIGINGSPKANGNTAQALAIMGEVFQQEGIDFEILHLPKNLAPCTGCFRCAKTHACTLPDDGLNDLYEKMSQADGVVFASPVYFASVTSLMRCFLDRAGCIDMNNGHRLRFKPGAPLVVARRAGTVNAIDELVHYISYAQMVMPGSLYWPLVFGNRPGEIHQDPEGVETVQVLAQSMAYLAKVLAAGGKEIPTPELPRKVYTNFIR